MLNSFPILSYLILLPLTGALLIFLFVKSSSRKNLFWSAITFAVMNFIISIKLLLDFNPNSSEFQFVENLPFIQGYDIKYYLGIDAISLLMVLLTTFLIPICLIVSINTIKTRVKEYVICFLLLECFTIGSFVAIDLILFYVFFESILIPMFFIVGIWGGKDKNYAAFKFFLYTLFGSVLFLISILYIYSYSGSTDIIYLKEELPKLSLKTQELLWLAMFMSFAIKVPMFPFHTWLPNAHVQAPTAGSIILAGVLIKLGAYGFIRFSLPFFPAASELFAPIIFILSVIAIIYTSIIALMQEDIKKMIAYSSIAHMGFVTIGIFAFNQQSIQGAVVQLVSHGLISAALFLSVGIIYESTKTREISKLGGIVQKMPYYSLFFMIFTMASIGLPGTSGFVGELLVIVGVFQVSKISAILAGFGIIFGACYMLWLYNRVIFGEVESELVKKLQDVNKIEFIILAILAMLIIFIGIYPLPILRLIDAPILEIVNSYQL